MVDKKTSTDVNLVQSIKNAIQNRSAKVCVIGIGYVGLPMAVINAKTGFNVLGIDRNSGRVDMLNHGRNYIQDVDDEELRNLTERGVLSASGDFTDLPKQDIIIICVPTPLNEYQDPDISYVENVAKEISKKIRKGQLIILESTTYPGTTQEIILPLLESSGLKVGEDFFSGILT